MRVTFANCLVAAAVMSFACGQLLGANVSTLFSTGMGNATMQLPDNAIDPHYVLTQVPAGSGFGPNSYIVDSSLYPLVTNEWMANSSTSKWISALADQTTFPNNPGSGNYVFRTTFNLTDFDPASTNISGQWTVDDLGLDILINGVSTGSTHNQALTFGTFSIGTGFVAGLNTLDFLMRNEPFGGFINPMGLRVELSATANPVPELTSFVLAVACALITIFRRGRIAP